MEVLIVGTFRLVTRLDPLENGRACLIHALSICRRGWLAAITGTPIQEWSQTAHRFCVSKAALDGPPSGQKGPAIVIRFPAIDYWMCV
ncbi:hypothetical protein ACFQDN_25370 [Pseudomonas asuensis]|uniref:Uncharacterized protein n=1 Tax=Pseudomonas asuensis TaxID=1825787 RepID=A0ABQ2GYR0_9PSED|nr:hypothetical protein [Pseudomonas asuensis]GGM17767.1 hypothetical protein GCM10009425_30870 [Pseudomonas asuensis]